MCQQAPKIDELRQKLRMRGIRCNLVYTHASSRLNVIPLYASRAQALRFVFHFFMNFINIDHEYTIIHDQSGQQ